MEIESVGNPREFDPIEVGCTNGCVQGMVGIHRKKQQELRCRMSKSGNDHQFQKVEHAL